jgi:hypothetical protein
MRGGISQFITIYSLAYIITGWHAETTSAQTSSATKPCSGIQKTTITGCASECAECDEHIDVMLRNCTMGGAAQQRGRTFCVKSGPGGGSEPAPPPPTPPPPSPPPPPSIKVPMACNASALIPVQGGDWTPQLLFGQTSYLSGTTVTLTCQPGYRATIPTTVTCTNGTFSKPVGTCVKAPSLPPPTPPASSCTPFMLRMIQGCTKDCSQCDEHIDVMLRNCTMGGAAQQRGRTFCVKSGPGGGSEPTPKLQPPSTFSYTVRFYVHIDKATQGSFDVAVHPDWAPIGAERFGTLLNHSWFDLERFFRVRNTQ